MVSAYVIKLVLKYLRHNLKILTRIFNFSTLAFLVFVAVKRIELLRKKSIKKLIFKESQENTYIVNNMEPLDFIPSLFIPTYLTQAGFHEMKSIQTTFFKREYIINYENYGQISLEWGISNKTFSDKLIILVHGLTGGSETVYIRDIVDAYKTSFTTVVIHARGINDTPLISTQITHAGLTDDIKYAMNHIRKHYTFKYVFLMGISMGANMTFQLLAQDRSFDDFLTGYISLSNPFNQLNVMKRHSGGLTDYVLLNTKKDYLLKNKDILFRHPNFDYERILSSEYTKDFDNELYAKLYGFENADDYYLKTSSGPLINKLKNIKTLILVAKDDPIVCLKDEDLINSKFL